MSASRRNSLAGNQLTGNQIEFRQIEGRCVVRRHWSSVARAAWLGASPDAELAAHRLGSEVGIAPRIITVDWVSRWMDIEQVEGIPIVLDELLDSSLRSALMALLDRLRSLAAADVPRLDLARRIDELLDRLSRVDSTAWLTWQRQWRALRADAVESDALPSRSCLVHGDLHSGNLLGDADGRLLCIDWEYAHRGHPLEDLAGLLLASSRWQSEWQRAQRASAPRPDWWPQDVFDALGCLGHAERVRRLGWWMDARRILDGVWMALAVHSAGNGPDA